MKMKDVIALIALMLVQYAVSGQNMVFDTKFEVNVQSTTAITNNKQIVGYAFFFKVDKMKKSGLYKLVILDENLKQIGSSEFEGGKDLVLTRAVYESDRLFMNFEDKDEYDGFKKFVKVFDLKGKQVGIVGYDPEKVKKGMFGAAAAAQMESMYDGIDNVETKGLVRVYQSKAKSGGVDMQFISTTGKLKWEKNFTGEGGDRIDMFLFGTTPNAIMMVQMERSGIASKKGEIFLVGLSPDNGRQIFKKSLTMKGFTYDPMFLKTTEDGKYQMIASLLNESEKLMKAQPVGISLCEIDDATGEIKVRKDFTYSGDLGKVLKMKSDTKSEEGYIKPHDLILMNDGGMVLVGEFFRKTVSAMGVASAMLSRSAQSVSQATIDDMFLMRIDNNLNPTSLETVEKDKDRFPLPGDFLSTGLVTRYLSSLKAFAYDYTDEGMNGSQKTVIANGSRPGAGYGVFAINLGEKSGFTIKDFKSLKEKNVRYYVTRAKPGYMMVTKYNSKEKSVSLSLEKTE